jgi:hypothetical protein
MTFQRNVAYVFDLMFKPYFNTSDWEEKVIKEMLFICALQLVKPSFEVTLKLFILRRQDLKDALLRAVVCIRMLKANPYCQRPFSTSEIDQELEEFWG